ncbi:MAG TPA: formate dehydrogenase accessory protein FdhE [Syntrophales bacterium]|nr:formate dehydrogenase accessory protein FdhE [Syntrophales bacterium]HRT62206.1 formate dehydrogenase accessory protein FdhE [Syntrophales bacterium]
MTRDLTRVLETIERYKEGSPHYKELLDILGEILILREEYRRQVKKSIFPIQEELIDAKLQGGLPIIDFGAGGIDLTEPRRFFFKLLEIGKAKNPEDTGEILKELEGGLLDYDKLVYDAFTQSVDEESEGEAEEESFDLLRFFIEESLRPALEFVAERYGGKISKSNWQEGYCPTCGRIPKIGELREEEGRRFLFCSQCGTRWHYKRVKCPFCGNEEQQSLAYFTVEGEEKYRVDVCDACKRYIKTVDFRSLAEEPDLDLEDIATLHLDILAHEEGYH